MDHKVGRGQDPLIRVWTSDWISSFDMAEIQNCWKDLDISSYEGAKCWNPGWGSKTKTGEWASHLESIGVNLLDKLTCKMRSYWANLYKDEICAAGIRDTTRSYLVVSNTRSYRSYLDTRYEPKLNVEYTSSYEVRPRVIFWGRIYTTSYLYKVV